MNIAQMIRDGEPAVAAAVAALTDPAIQSDALAKDLRTARGAISELERKVFEQEQALVVLRACLHRHQRDADDPPGYLQDAVIRAAGLGALHEQRDAAVRERDALRSELERERMRLAACGVVAGANTPDSAAKARDMHPDYRSASCKDVADAVDREMAMRAELAELRDQKPVARAEQVGEQVVARWLTSDHAMVCPAGALLYAAPAAAVPAGWTIERRDDAVIVMHHKIGGYAAKVDSENIASAVLAQFALDVLAAAPATPAGWQLVPVEPTFEQIMAAARAAKQYMDECGGNSPTVVYQAMLAAAPKGGE